ncbi:thiol-disulfide isomerase [Caulobacter sp. Root1455]|uniref:thioredoxin family protein n=1 Tax=unclassified Caulobacter TaxID=2648921 RepID=UPI0007008D1F|nr:MULTISPECIES: thioredoxin family protein [unclassified Caulobacter]KQY35578.1 thiol-disulfide isomerase [Caulobacter sp. Root487D2Y]KQZ06457.1 thiol-disulfide isomerase [Caulobacter sp. Root1455]
MTSRPLAQLGRLGVLAALLIAAPVSAFAAKAPTVALKSLAELPTPLPYPYDEKADAEADVAAAIKKAKARHKLVLIDLGGNWCGDCRVFAGMIEQPDLKAFVDKHYEVVTVNVGRYDHNMQIPARYGIDRLNGVPTFLVVDTKGKLVNPDALFALTDARHMTPQSLADWLARWPK